MSTIKSSAENLTLNADGANNDVIIQSNASTKVTVDGATGNVGIGTVSPTSILNLHNATGSDSDGARETKLTFSGQKASGAVKRTGSIKAVHHGTGNDGLGRLEFEGGESGTKVSVTSDGLTFNGDTAAANALDDYEEGSWTPVFRGSTTAGTYSYAVQNGYYTKIGRLVTVTCSLFNIDDAGGAGAGNIEIAGLPFTSSDDTHRGMIGTLELDNFTFSGSLSVTAENTTTYVILRASSSGAGDYVLLVGARDSDGSDLCFSLTYQV